ncbi:MAG TPA: hypothetical protein VGF14_04425 [Alphaproteobacteria bacterium]
MDAARPVGLFPSLTRLGAILGCCFCCATAAQAQMGRAAMDTGAGAAVPKQALVVEVRPQQIDEISVTLDPTIFYDEADDVDGKAYRQRAHDQKISLLLYGVTNAQPANGEIVAVQPMKAATQTKNLKQFLDSHFDEIKRDYFNQDDPEATRLVTGEASFISEAMVTNNAQKPAKLAGFTVPAGDWTVGGGYTWGEENPLLMKVPKKGVIVGARYDGLKVPIQISYMTTGRDIGVASFGGDYAYDNVMVWTTIPIKEKWFLNTTLQYRNDRNRMEDEQRQFLITVGTKIKF